MVSFQCDGCADTVKKPKLDQHRQRCQSSFTCLDCSTTFRNPSEYKSHTSCVTEAEKYQGALYRGPKKNEQAPSQSQTPAAPSPSPADASSSIHPSRLSQMNSTAPSQSFAPRGGAAGRGGRGGRGGFQRGGYGGGAGYVERVYATSENTANPQGGMRSWGSPAVEASPKPEEAEAQLLRANGNAPVADKKKKNKKGGDKGGTGSKANSKNPPPAVTITTPVESASTEPKSKKRKLEEESTPTANDDAPESVSSKTLKRLKKRFGKLEEKSGDMTLGEWIESLGKDKDKAVESAEILKAIKVSRKDGSFVLSL